MTHTVTTPKRLDAVTAELAGFAGARDWHPGAVACVRLDPGPPRVGSRWLVPLRFGPFRVTLNYTLTRRGPHWLTFRARHSGLTLTLDFACTELDNGTEIHLSVQCRGHGPVTLALPFVVRPLTKLADRTTTALDRDPAEEELRA